jgi:hypothetical protein
MSAHAYFYAEAVHVFNEFVCDHAESPFSAPLKMATYHDTHSNYLLLRTFDKNIGQLS